MLYSFYSFSISILFQPVALDMYIYFTWSQIKRNKARTIQPTQKLLKEWWHGVWSTDLWHQGITLWPHKAKEKSPGCFFNFFYFNCKIPVFLIFWAKGLYLRVLSSSFFWIASKPPHTFFEMVSLKKVFFKNQENSLFSVDSQYGC